MDLSVFIQLNADDCPQLKDALNKCKDYDEAWKVLKEFEKDLDGSINELQSKVNGHKIVDELHKYNEMKDMTQAVMGSLATLQGVTFAKVHEQFNLLNE